MSILIFEDDYKRDFAYKILKLNRVNCTKGEEKK